MKQLDLCRFIATVAHESCGQKRADKLTPYITHPARVAELTERFYKSNAGFVPIHAVCAAWLHDVLEDTKLTDIHLEEYGVSPQVIDIVNRLTKTNGNEPATPEYYQGIAESELALYVKAADRCANLEDSLGEVKRTNGLKRWRRYVEKTHKDVLPLYEHYPFLAREIKRRLEEIEDALDGR